jgi:hypothetical protein
VGPRAGLDEAVKRKTSQPLPGLEPPIIQPVAQSYTADVSRLKVIIYQPISLSSSLVQKLETIF